MGVTPNRADRGAGRAPRRPPRAKPVTSEPDGQYRLLFEANPNPMWVFDEQTLRFLAVAALESLLEAEPREREVRNLLPVVRGAAPDAAARRAELLSRRTWAAQVLAGDGWFAILLKRYCAAVDRYAAAFRLDPSIAGQLTHLDRARARCRGGP